MAAVSLGDRAFITKAPPWSKHPFKMGRLGFEPGELPRHLEPFLLRKGEVAKIADECRKAGKMRRAMVRCLNQGVRALKMKH